MSDASEREAKRPRTITPRRDRPGWNDMVTEDGSTATVRDDLVQHLPGLRRRTRALLPKLPWKTRREREREEAQRDAEPTAGP